MPTWLLLVIFLIIVSIIGGGIWTYVTYDNNESNDDAKKK